MRPARSACGVNRGCAAPPCCSRASARWPFPRGGRSPGMKTSIGGVPMQKERTLERGAVRLQSCRPCRDAHLNVTGGKGSACAPRWKARPIGRLTTRADPQAGAGCAIRASLPGGAGSVLGGRLGCGSGSPAPPSAQRVVCSSPVSTTSATALTRSSSFRFITRTPVAERPCWEMPAAGVRWTIPPTLMKTSSWWSRTTSAPARPPFSRSARPS